MSSADVPTVPSSLGTSPGSTSPQFSGPGSFGPDEQGMLGPPGGQLPGSPGADDASKEVTIRDGDRAITVGEPDQNGRSTVTVDDAEPAEYVIDWTAEPGEVLGEGVIRAEDGRAVIQDGDASIILEQVSGPTDRLTMTIDDGTPETYDLDFGSDSGLPDPSTQVPGQTPPSSFGQDGGSFTTTAGAGGGGGGGSFGGVETPSASSATPIGGATGMMTGAQAPDAGMEPRPAPVPSGGGGGSAGGGTPGTMGAMPMGGMGAGGQGGGDETRQSKWRTTGQLFDQDPVADFSGVVGRDPAEKANPNPKS